MSFVKIKSWIVGVLLLTTSCGLAPSTQNQKAITQNHASQQNSTIADQTALASAAPIPHNPLDGQIAPEFRLHTLDGNKTVTLHQLLQNGPVLINAFASWCPPCQMETPELVALAKKYHDKIQFIGVNMTTHDKISNLKSFVKHYGISYPVLLDEKGTFEHAYHILGYPTTMVILPDGRFQNVYVGGLINVQFAAMIAKATAVSSK
jgi:cytochrome c biogenesis protein CcmG/thiol:disulfide interchange protein DsbE